MTELLLNNLKCLRLLGISADTIVHVFDILQLLGPVKIGHEREMSGRDWF